MSQSAVAPFDYTEWYGMKFPR